MNPVIRKIPKKHLIVMTLLLLLFCGCFKKDNAGEVHSEYNNANNQEDSYYESILPGYNENSVTTKPLNLSKSDAVQIANIIFNEMGIENDGKIAVGVVADSTILVVSKYCGESGMKKGSVNIAIDTENSEILKLWYE